MRNVRSIPSLKPVISDESEEESNTLAQKKIMKINEDKKTIVSCPNNIHRSIKKLVMRRSMKLKHTTERFPAEQSRTV